MNHIEACVAAFPLPRKGIAYDKCPEWSRCFGIAMAGLVPAIHVLRAGTKQDVDARPKPGMTIGESESHVEHPHMRLLCSLAVAKRERWSERATRVADGINRLMQSDGCVQDFGIIENTPDLPDVSSLLFRMQAALGYFAWGCFRNFGARTFQGELEGLRAR